MLSPPDDVRRAGIWSDGAPLADDGRSPTVITGHVSDRTDRAGAFLALWDVQVGAVAVTVDEDGAERRWRVVGVRHVAKDALSRAEFLPGTERRLRLITCASRQSGTGGAFHYADNLIVDLAPQPTRTVR
ncbi:class F sortase [Pimelobacter sp. 30-1]|uniref:class F sortase n=1 Tax=Pimelobacter TaxID=2044 RepID=UPI001C05C41B|nr:class F sortase [Pimelobacter sp. 30-1]